MLVNMQIGLSLEDIEPYLNSEEHYIDQEAENFAQEMLSDDDGYASDDDVYVIEKIVRRRLLPGRKASPNPDDYEYLVKWKDWGSGSNTWEPYDHLDNCEKILRQFMDDLMEVALSRRRPKKMFEETDDDDVRPNKRRRSS